MDFPRKFDIDWAIELGELVDQAYLQFEAYQHGGAWKLSENYTLITELNYPRPTEKNIIQNSGFFDLDLRGFGWGGGQHERDVPIGFIACRERDVFLIFRGTVTDQEWIRNFTINLEPYLLPDFGEVHDGFMRIYSLFRAVIKEALDGLDARSTLFIAGHSLGGALATIALPDIGTWMAQKKIVLYTYGSPRIGDNAFVTAFNRYYSEKSFRIVNTCDMVGLIPPPAPLGAIGGYFSHVDTQVDFTVQCDDVVKNHDIRTYVSTLKEFRAKRGIVNRLKSWYAQHFTAAALPEKVEMSR